MKLFGEVIRNPETLSISELVDAKRRRLVSGCDSHGMSQSLNVQKWDNLYG